MFRTTRTLRHPGPWGLTLPALLRRVSALLLLAALLTATLAACGGNDEEKRATETVPAAPTPEAQMEQGAELTTQEYAEALEEAFSGRDDEIEDAAEDLLGGTPFTSAELERISSLETAESWSEEDAAFMSEYAETILEAATSLYDVILGTLKEAIDEISGLRPPGHLSAPHNNFVASLGEALRVIQEQVDTVKDADTDIRDREDLADFEAVVNSLESGPIDPELAQRAEDLTAQLKEACLELKEQLEAELEREVSICDG